MAHSRNSLLFFGTVMFAVALYLPLLRGSTSLVGGWGLDYYAPTATTGGGIATSTISTTARVTSNMHGHPYNIIINNNNNNTNHEDNVSFCFIVSVYGQWAAHVDQLQRVDKLIWYNQSQFFAFTNLPNLNCKGWTKVVQPLNQYRRYITQSRYAKFFAWNDTTIQKAGCQVVFYMDAIGHIRHYHKTSNASTFSSFARLARQIYHSPQGYAQYQHRGGGGAFGEFRRIQVFSKDLPENSKASMDWMKAQPDFRHPSQHNCTLYENRYIGYAVRPTTTLAVAATHCFWPRYSLEVDSWRDQPLWCYCLDKTIHHRYHNNNSNNNSNDHVNYHHHPITAITPITTTTTALLPPLPLNNHQDLWQLRPHRMGKKMKHQYHSEYAISKTTNTTGTPTKQQKRRRKKPDNKSTP